MPDTNVSIRWPTRRTRVRRAGRILNQQHRIIAWRRIPGRLLGGGGQVHRGPGINRKYFVCSSRASKAKTSRAAQPRGKEYLRSCLVFLNRGRAVSGIHKHSTTNYQRPATIPLASRSEDEKETLPTCLYVRFGLDYPLGPFRISTCRGGPSSLCKAFSRAVDTLSAGATTGSSSCSNGFSTSSKGSATASVSHHPSPASNSFLSLSVPLAVCGFSWPPSFPLPYPVPVPGAIQPPPPTSSANLPLRASNSSNAPSSATMP